MSTAHALWVEVLDRRGHVVQRVRAGNAPLTIGRGYHCDIRVDDAHVAPTHVTLVPDAQTGGATLIGEPSRNPIRVVGLGQALASGASLPLAHGVHLITIGKTQVRVVVGQPIVPAEKPLLAEHSRWERYALWLLLAVLSVNALETWFGMTETVKPGLIVVNALTLAGVLVAWAGAWSFVTRLLQGYPAFLSHLALAAGAGLAVTTLVWLIDLVSFALNLPNLSRWRVLLFGLILVAVIIGHLKRVNGGHSSRVNTAVVVAALGMLTVMFINNYQSYKTIAPSSFMSHVLPSSWRLAGEITTDSFYQRVQAQKESIDALQKVESDDEGFLE